MADSLAKDFSSILLLDNTRTWHDVRQPPHLGLMDLPAEVRLLIWRLVIPSTVDIELCEEHRADTNGAHRDASEDEMQPSHSMERCDQRQWARPKHTQCPPYLLVSKAVYEDTMYFYRQQTFALNYSQGSCLSWFLGQLTRQSLRQQLVKVRKRSFVDLEEYLDCFGGHDGHTLSANDLARLADTGVMERHVGAVDLVHCDVSVYPDHDTTDDGDADVVVCFAEFVFKVNGDGQ